MGEETNKKQNEEVSDKKLESTAGGLGVISSFPSDGSRSLLKKQKGRCPSCGKEFVIDAGEYMFYCDRCGKRL